MKRLCYPSSCAFRVRRTWWSDIFLGLHPFWLCEGDGLGCVSQGWCLGNSSFEEEQGPPLLSSTLAARALGHQEELLLSLLNAGCQRSL